MFDEMVNMKGTFCLGADYRLPATYKRGRTIEQVEALEEKVGSTFFNTNYRSRWLNTNGSCIVDIEKLQKLQVIPKPELKPVKDGEYYISVDVARSAKNSNNETAISVLKIKRDKKEKIKNIQAINMIKLPNGTNFQTQSLHIKRLQLYYGAKVLVVDVNGLGIGLGFTVALTLNISLRLVLSQILKNETTLDVTYGPSRFSLCPSFPLSSLHRSPSESAPSPRSESGSSTPPRSPAPLQPAGNARAGYSLHRSNLLRSGCDKSSAALSAPASTRPTRVARDPSSARPRPE